MKALSIEPSEVIPYANPRCLGASAHGKYIFYESSSINSFEIVKSDGCRASYSKKIAGPVTWASVDSTGKYIAYGFHSDYRSEARLNVLESMGKEDFSINLNGAIEGVFSGRSFWLLVSSGEEAYRIEKRGIPDFEVEKSVEFVLPGNHPQYLPRSSYPFFLREAFRPSAIGGAGGPFGVFFGEEDESGELRMTAVAELSPLLPVHPFFAPHGGELIAMGRDEVCRVVYPYDKIATRMPFKNSAQTGCYLDDVHFLTTSESGALCLIHTRSMQIVAEYVLKGNIRPRLQNAHVCGDFVYLTLAAVSYPTVGVRFVINRSDFFKDL